MRQIYNFFVVIKQLACSSVHASSGIVQSLLPINVRGQQCNHYESALNEWKVRSGSVDLPQNPIFQSEWDKPLYETRFNEWMIHKKPAHGKFKQ